MPYSPQPPISVSTLEEMRSWLNEELRSIALAINETQVVDLRPSFKAPDRLRDGVMVYADGTNFNPGSGEGPYIWDGAAWRPMIGLTAAQSAAIAANVAANTAAITTLQATSPPGLVFLSSQLVSSPVASVVFTGIGSTYDAYQFSIARVKPSAHNATLWVQISVDGGVTWKNTSNIWTWLYSTITGGAAAYGHNSSVESQAYFRISGATSSTWGNESEVMLYPSIASLNTLTWRSIDFFDTGGGAYQVIGSGHEASDATRCNAVRFLFASGNVVAGRINMYGVRKL